MVTEIWVNIGLGYGLLPDDTNVDWSSVKSSDIQIRAISQVMPQPSITKISMKITCLKFHWNFPGANELICIIKLFQHNVYFITTVDTDVLVLKYQGISDFWDGVEGGFWVGLGVWVEVGVGWIDCSEPFSSDMAIFQRVLGQEDNQCQVQVMVGANKATSHYPQSSADFF